MTQGVSDKKDKGYNIKEVYKYYKIPIKNQLSTINIKNHIKDKIMKLLDPNKKTNQNYSILKKIKNQLILNFIINNITIKAYYNILELILDFSRQSQNIISFRNSSIWKKIIKLTMEYIKITPNEYNFDKDHLNRIENKTVILGESAKFFKDLGFRININNGEARLSDKDQNKIANELNDIIKSIGGINVIILIFQFHKAQYNKKLERYKFIRRVGFSNKKKEADIPVGYLLNLSVKNLYPTINIPNLVIDSQMQELIEKARNFCALYNVQPFNQYENLFISMKRLPIFFQETVLYDTIYTINQFRPNDLLKFLIGMFNSIDIKDFQNKIGWDINNGIELMVEIFNYCKKNHNPTIIPKKNIYKQFSNLITTQIDNILDSFSHNLNEVNQKYQLPHEFDNCDFMFKPLIKRNNNEYILLNTSWCSINIYENLMQLIKDNIDKKIHDKIGDQIETFLKQEFDNHKIFYHYGKYKKGDDECDLVVEAKDTIILIEIKKKALIRHSRSGNDVNIFIDISKSLIDSVYQLNKHELQLINNDKLELESGTIKLKDREIEKISLTLLDFASLQDRMIIQQILDIFIRTEFNPFDIQYQKEFDKINKKSRDISQQINDISSYYKKKYNRDIYRPFYYYWFLSVPQLLVVLDDVDSNESFKESLFLSRHVTMGTHDFYFEHSYAKELKK